MLSSEQVAEIKNILENEYCSTEEAAQLLNVTRGRVNRFCAEQRIKGAFKIRDTWFIPISEAQFVQRKPQGNFTNHKRGSKLKQEVTQWLEAAGYGGNGN